MKKFRLGSIVIRIALLPSIAFVSLLTLLVSLGIWQLGRADQKAALLELQKQRIQDAPLQLNATADADAEALRYRKVMVQGHYDGAHQFLVDNQVFNGRVGFFVLTPYKIGNSELAVLVNRGWVPANANRTVLPNVTMDTDAGIVSGRIDHFPAVGMKLAGAEIPSDGWPAVVQVVDSQVLAKRLGYALHDFQVELDAGEPNGYSREWKINTAMSPEKHIAYAFQWFGLALTLVIIFIWLSCKKHDNE